MLKRIAYIPLILYFLPAFVVHLFLPKTITYTSIIIPFVLGLFFILSPVKFVNNFTKYFKITPLKYFCFFYLAIFITSFFAALFGRFSFSRMLYVTCFTAVFQFVLFYFYPLMIIPRYISLRNIVKFFLFVYIFIFLWGFIEFLGVTLNINIINSLVSVFSNIRPENLSVIIESNSGLARIRSIFLEPSSYGHFLTINLPILFAYIKNKGKLFKNNLFNLALRIFLLVSYIITLILIQSPIYFVINILIIFCIHIKSINMFVRTYFLYILFLLLFVFLISTIIIFNTNLEHSFLIRIINVLNIITNFNLTNLIDIEASLATRVLYMIDLVKIWMHHPIIGLGLSNNGVMFIQYFSQLKMPLTPEMELSLIKAYSEGVMFTHGVIGPFLLCYTGIIGFASYIIFMFSLIRQLKKSINCFQHIEYLFVRGLYQSIIVMFILSLCYTQLFYDQLYWFMCGLATAVIYISNNKAKITKIKVLNLINRRNPL